MSNYDNNNSETNHLFYSFFDNPKTRQEVLNETGLLVLLSCTRLLCFGLNRTDVFLLACSFLNSKFYIFKDQ